MANLVELFDNIVQMQNLNGVPLAAGKLYVYALGRTRLMDSWSDVDGESLNPNPIILDDAGQAHVYVSDDFDYTIVVCDQYNNEIFSLDKYLYSEGSHSHADVAVAPSESIAVSSYHVGECTVYVPYLTGQLGKVYEGIDPIVVNNQVDKISANHVPLGVQDPLYFVQDDEEACIIGFSGEALPEGTMNESAFGYEDGKITGYNGSGFSAGLNYEAGSYVDINGNTINVTGLQPAGNYQSAGDYVVHDELSSYATQDWVENQSYMKEYMESAFYPSTSNPSGYLTEHQDLSDYAKTEDLTAYQPVGNYYSASNPDGFINSDAISAMATTGFVADVSGDITALIPDTSDMATKTWVGEQGYLTEHQSLDGLMSADLLESSGGLITGYNGSAFAGQGGGVTGDFTLVEGNGIQLTDDPIAQTTTISVSGDYATNTQLQNVSADITAMIPTALTGDYLDKASADTLYYPLNSNPNNYLTTAYTPDFAYHDSAISAIDESAIYDTSAHARINTLAGRINTLSSDKADVTALADYQTTADMVNYQTTAAMTGYQEAGEYYSASNPSGFISDVPDTYLQNTDLSTTDGKVTAISGIPLSAGGDVPEGVMVESGLEYNAVNEISAYNGSAIAQYGAEKQWLVHDDTLVHLSNSSQYALGINMSAISADLARMMGVDETVLWSGSTKVNTNNTITLSEPLTAFNKFRIYDIPFRIGSSPWLQQPINETTLNNVDNGQNYLFGTVHGWVDSWNSTASGSKYRGYCFYSGDSDLTHILCMGSFINSIASSGKYDMRNEGFIYKVVGIGRKEV